MSERIANTERACQLTTSAERLLANGAMAGFVACQLCEKSDFLLARIPAQEGGQAVIQSELVTTCNAGEMPLYPEVLFSS